MHKRLTALILGTLTSLALLFVGPFNVLMSSMSMNGMASAGQCQASCGTQTPVAVQAVKQKLRDEEHEPQPAEPYYLAFITVGWTTTVAVAAAFLFKYLRWRPPDFTKLYAVYRF